MSSVTRCPIHVVRVVEPLPRGPQAFLPPDAEHITVVAGQRAAHLVQFVLFGGTEVDRSRQHKEGGPCCGTVSR